MPPGRATVTIPLHIFVGERSVIQQRRRLDLARVRRLVLSLSGTLAPVYIDNVRLEAEPPLLTEFPTLVRLDLGPPDAPVERGFTQVLSSLYYSPRRGYGLSPDAVVSTALDRQHPTELFRDWIAFRSGGLDVDVPSDTYTVAVWLQDAGEWE